MGVTATQAKAKHELVEKAEHLSHYSIEIKEQYKRCTTKEAKYHWKKFTELKMKKKISVRAECRHSKRVSM